MISPTHYRSLLKPEEQAAYRVIVNNLLKHTGRFTVPTADVSQTSIRKTVYAVACDHPELFFVNFRKYHVVKRHFGQEFKFELLLDRKASDYISRGLNRLRDNLTGKIERSDSSAQQKYLHIAREIVAAAAYLDSDDTSWDHSADPLLRHMTVFEGAAKIFLFLCQRFELPCAIVRGTVDGERHVWNMVEIDERKMFVDVASVIDCPKRLFPSQRFFRSREYLLRHGYKWNEATLWRG